ncbi:adenylate/guanylate cyclase domain-containing protein [Rothia mucilaginosa]|uniref:adenylate/guanylate cyclase domain-containing protein n=1 Tax=Rothia mucilaginosa TaxID=43675 RepID=UPI0026EFC8A5|nr:adenylate/guanylate cyclase domain-containing protein [Rothia mucilaginosa]
MSTANHYRPEPSPQDSGSVTPAGASGGSMGPETQMLNLKILQNLAQNNIYRDERSKEGVRALEKSLLGEGDRYTPSQAAELAGIPLKAARRIWRNMGFPDIAPNIPYFTETDVRMLSDLRALDDEGTIRMEYVVSLVRAEGQLTDRTVAWQIEALVHNIMVTENVDDNEARRKLLLDFPRYLEVLEHLAVYAYRRQMYAGILRLGLRENNATSSGIAHLPLVRGVGFVDLVSYTSLVRNLDAAALSQLINHFEQSCLDVIAPLGGRIIKTLGDEVFFLTETPDAIAEISLQLSEKIGVDPHLPDVRVAFIWGEVLANRGDVYGSSVNLASRLVSLAEPGTVLTDNETANTLRQVGNHYTLTSQGTRNVRSFGNVDPVAVTRRAHYTMEINLS